MAGVAKTLEAAIREVSGALVGKGTFTSCKEINAGYCGDFVCDVYERLGGVRAAMAMGVSEHDIAQFLVPGAHGLHEGTPFDRGLIAQRWPGIRPPEGMDWDGLDRMSSDLGFDPCTHVFMALDGRFYDAEAPEGVENLFDLPFFARAAMAWMAEQRPFRL